MEISLYHASNLLHMQIIEEYMEISMYLATKDMAGYMEISMYLATKHMASYMEINLI